MDSMPMGKDSSQRLCRVLGEIHCEHAQRRGFREVEEGSELTAELFGQEKEEEDSREATEGLKRKVPGLGERWRKKDRFKEAFRVQWTWREPSNVVETRTIALAVQGLGRTRQHWDKRVLLATDNLAALAALGKGRSSKEPMSRICRKYAAFSLAYGISLFVRWVPSVWNWADGPSRGHGIKEVEKVKAAEFAKKEKAAEEEGRRKEGREQKQGIVRGGRPKGYRYHG